MVVSESPVPLRDGERGVALETRRRLIQNGTDVYWVSLNRGWLSQLGLQTQGEPTVHAYANRPVTIRHPAIVIQPAEVIEK